MREETYSAFTVAELGEGLPDNLILILTPDNSAIWNIWKKNGHWFLSYGDFEEHTYKDEADTEANARALMRIYLIENGLVKI